jgi:hypothetical protein
VGPLGSMDSFLESPSVCGAAFDAPGEAGTRNCLDTATQQLDRTVFRHTSAPSEGAWGFVVNPRGTQQQPNEVDCGVHACLCMRVLMATAPGDMPRWWYTCRDCVSAARYIISTEIMVGRLLDPEAMSEEGGNLEEETVAGLPRVFTPVDWDEWQANRPHRGTSFVGKKSISIE